ncbi:MAG: hypothetical protein AAF598_08855 [Bacteroidota bacterium]
MAISREQIQAFEQIHQQPQKLRLSRFYGIDRVIKQYLNLPDWFPLALVAYLEHGINVNPDWVAQRLKDASRDIVFLDNAHRVGLVPKHFKAYPLGPPFILARRLYGIQQDPHARGTLAFPVHSSHTRSIEFDWRRYAELLTQLPEYMQPVTACVYWLDILRGRHQVFEELGIDVITNGHMLDPAFAERCNRNISKFRYQTGNKITSAAFYGLDMKVPFFLYGHDQGLKPSDAAYRAQFDNHPYMKRIEACLTFDSLEQVKVGSEQEALLSDYLDESSWISPERGKKLVWQHSPSVIVNKGMNEFQKQLGLKKATIA